MSTVYTQNGKNFNRIPFKLTLPKIQNEGTLYRINFSIVNATVKLKDLVLSDVVVSNNMKNVKIAIDHYFSAISDEKPVEIKIPKNDKLNLKHMTMSFHFIAEDRFGYTVSYDVDNNRMCSLNSTSVDLLLLDERVYFQQTKKQYFSKQVGNSKSSNKYSLEMYKQKIAEEIKFLKVNGGRKYKVNNGVFVSVINHYYSYSFDLEAELAISDDSPVTLILSNNQVSGTVLSCEGF